MDCSSAVMPRPSAMALSFTARAAAMATPRFSRRSFSFWISMVLAPNSGNKKTRLKRVWGSSRASALLRDACEVQPGFVGACETGFFLFQVRRSGMLIAELVQAAHGDIGVVVGGIGDDADIEQLGLLDGTQGAAILGIVPCLF